MRSAAGLENDFIVPQSGKIQSAPAPLEQAHFVF